MYMFVKNGGIYLDGILFDNLEEPREGFRRVIFKKKSTPLSLFNYDQLFIDVWLLTIPIRQNVKS